MNQGNNAVKQGNNAVRYSLLHMAQLVFTFPYIQSKQQMLQLFPMLQSYNTGNSMYCRNYLNVCSTLPIYDQITKLTAHKLGMLSHNLNKFHCKFP